MTTLSDYERQRVHKALAVNYAIMCYAYRHLPPETIATMEEMVDVTAQPYNPANLEFVGDTLDRHSYSCVGNLNEVIAMMTLLKYEYGWCETARFLRSIEDQVSTKADITIGDMTYQVKTVRYGTGGQMFIAEHELEGTAHYMAYVGGRENAVYVFDRAMFRRNMKNLMDIGGPYDRWYGHAGWFVTPAHCNFITRLEIPPGVATYM